MSLYSSLTQVLAPFAAKINGLLTGWDGTRYQTPGEAVRQQIADLHVLIGDEPGTAIQSSAVAYGESDVEAALDGVNGRLQQEQAIIGDLSNLQTEDKTDIVSAINEAAQTGGTGSGLTADIKNALLQIASKVAYIDAHGQDYYDALYDSFYPSVVSISAAYNQRGTVYSTTDLNSLKSNLVVTANYKDGTNIRLSKSDYTLSGKLTTGTSIITVIYGDKVATFNVTVTGVVSIDAVYTQSRTITVFSALSDLIPDLTVTAILNDGGTFTVPSSDYVLNGTLESGISTITVTYGELTDTFDVNVIEVIDYTINPLDGITWHDGYTYDRDTGVLTAASGEHCTEKFTAQNCIYQFRNRDTTNNRYFAIFAWDDKGNYLGLCQYEASLFSLRKGTYAIKVYNTGTFDASTLSLMPKDNTNTAAPEFSIKLSDYIGNITSPHNDGRFEFSIRSVMSAADITIDNITSKINSCNYLAAVSPATDSFTRREFTFWLYNINTLIFMIQGINTVADAESWITANDPVIRFNY